MWSTGKKFSERGGSCFLAVQRSVPCITPLKMPAADDNPNYRTPSSHETLDKRSSEASPYVRAKHVQMVDKDPQKSIPLFWAAINSGDRVDSALKDMAFSMKQLNRAEEAIEAIKSFRNLCSPQSQESIDNVLLELYKKCGRIDEQIKMLQYKLKMIDEGVAFGGRATKLTRYKGKRFHVSVEHEKSRILGNLAWAYMQLENYQEAEPLYRRALSIEEDYNKQCNLAICMMRTGRLEEGKIILQCVKREWIENCDEASIKSLERASQVLMELEFHGNLKEKKEYSPKQDAAFEDGKNELTGNPQHISFLRREKMINSTKHTLEKAPSTDDRKLPSDVLYACDHNELHDGNSISSGNLMDKNKSQRSINSGQGIQSFNDTGKEECEISSRKGHGYMAFDCSSSFWLGIKEASSKFRNKEQVYCNSREKCNILKPKSLNRIWAAETEHTLEKCKGSLDAHSDDNLNKESDAFLNNGMLIGISEEKTPTRSSKIHQYHISKNDSDYCTSDIKADGMTSFLTGSRSQADLFEEEELSTPNTMAASEDNLKTQLIKKSKRKTWADMVDEEEQFASQKLSTRIGLDDENVVTFEDGFKTQLVHKCERRTQTYMGGEDEPFNNVSCHHSKVSVKRLGRNRELSKECFQTRLVSGRKRSSWIDFPQGGSLPDGRNGLTGHSNLSVKRALLFDAEPTSDQSIDCSVLSMEAISPPISAYMTTKEMGHTNNSGSLNSHPVVLQSRLQVFQEITCDDMEAV